MNVLTLSKEQLLAQHQLLRRTYDDYCARGLSLNMARGKPSPEQLDLSNAFLQAPASYISQGGLDARNYSTPDGEIDLIATDGKVLAFVEVKLRDQTCPSTPGEAVTRSKQRKISKTAACFLAKHPTNLQPRFDVLEISLVSEQEVRFHLIAGAFMPEENYGLL